MEETDLYNVISNNFTVLKGDRVETCYFLLDAVENQWVKKMSTIIEI